VASRPVRIEVRGYEHERDEARRDFQRTLGALEDRLLPQRAARRLVEEHGAVLTVAGMVAAGLALGLVGSRNTGARTSALVSAAVAGAIFARLLR
jgi:hypothetical protein